MSDLGGPREERERERAPSRTAVLVLARSPRVEARLKGLDRGRSAGSGSRLFRASLGRTIRAARLVAGADLHVAIAPEDRRAVRRATKRAPANRFLQTGATFGERVENAVSRLRDLGYTHVVVLAGDCPGISARHVARAQKALVEDDVVLGPSADGGLYLLGLRTESLDGLALRSVPWRTEDVRRAVESRALARSLSVRVLDRLDDIDDSRSARCFLRDALARARRDAASFLDVLSLLREALRREFSSTPDVLPIRIGHMHDVAILWRRPPPRD
jgi:glycosyltransferase A (GT-A) superfamily protein (DUF2064 family)